RGHHIARIARDSGGQRDHRHALARRAAHPRARDRDRAGPGRRGDRQHRARGDLTDRRAPLHSLPVADYTVTPDGPAPTKRELLAALAASRDEVLALVRSMDPARLEDGRYENGWNGRQILAHIASIEWTYPRLIDIARTPPAPVEQAPPTRSMKGGNDSYNDRQVAKREGMTVGELLAEF